MASDRLSNFPVQSVADPLPIQVAASTSGQSPAPPKQSEPADEPFDPFAKSDESTGEEYDPWEPLNTKVFEFNR